MQVYHLKGVILTTSCSLNLVTRKCTAVGGDNFFDRSWELKGQQSGITLNEKKISRKKSCVKVINFYSVGKLSQNDSSAL